VRHTDFPDEPERQRCRNDARVNRGRHEDDPPIKDGQVKMPTQQCTAFTRRGVRCGSKTCHGEYCWNHLRQFNSLRIKTSEPPIVGKGLFAERDFNTGETVSQYTGDLYRSLSDSNKKSDYILEINRARFIDAARTNSAPARMANDPRGTGKIANCKFVANQRIGEASLVTLRPVKKGEEFLVSYGVNYWKDKLKGIPTVRTKQGNTRDNPIVVAAAEACSAVSEIHPMSASLGDPQSFKEIMSRPDKEQWLRAHKKEHQAQLDNGTYSIILRSALPPSAHLLTWKDVYKLKRGPDGKPISYKARFTIRGCSQQPSEYGDISAQVFHLRTLRTVCALVAEFDWEFKQLDVNSAFLQGDLKEELYAVPPKGLGIDHTHAVKLHKTIYGLKQAGHEWQVKLFAMLAQIGYHQLRYVDRCLWVRKSKTNRLLVILVYVDDLPYAYDKADSDEMSKDIQELMRTFSIKDLGDAEYILGWRVTRDRVKRKLMLDQEGYTSQILEDYGLLDCKLAKSPGTAASLLFQEAQPNGGDSSSYHDVHLHAQIQLKDYRSVIGALQYLAGSTRPDIADSVNKAAKFSANPQAHHLQAVKKILRYLAGTKGQALCYTGSELSHSVIKLEVYADADWASDIQDRKSTTGWLVKLCGAAVSWCSRRQDTVAKSTMEAEYIAASSVVDEVVWFRRLLSELQQKQTSPTITYMDNQSAIAAALEGGKESRRKHIDVKHHSIVEHIDNGDVILRWIPSAQNEADLFTKALPDRHFILMSHRIMGLDNSTMVSPGATQGIAPVEGVC
jgi:hypothetical protein